MRAGDQVAAPSPSDRGEDWKASGPQWYALAILTLASMVGYLDRQILVLLVDPIRKSLDVSDTGIGLLQGIAFALFYTALGLPIGHLADRLSRRHIIAAGAFLWGMMTAMCGLANSFLQLFIARVGVGVGESTINPTSISMIGDLFPPSRRVLAMSILIASGSLGSGLALTLGGALIDAIETHRAELPTAMDGFATWQLVFVVVGLPGSAMSLLLLTIREPARRATASDRGESSWGDLRRFFWAHKQLFGAYFGAMACFAIIVFAMQAWVPTYFIRLHGWTASDVGAMYGPAVAAAGLTGALCGGAFAAALRRRGRRDACPITVSIGIACLGLSAAVAPMIPAAHASLAVYGLAWFFQAFPLGAAATVITEIVPSRLRAKSVALYYLVINVCGIGFGPLTVPLLSERLSASAGTLRAGLAAAPALFAPVALLLMLLSLLPFRRIVGVANTAALSPAVGQGTPAE